jgi:hypothetical protein
MWRFLRKPRRPSVDEIRLLCLLGDDRDRTLIASLCQTNGWKVNFTDQPEQARHHKPHIMLFDRALAEQDWKEVIAGLAEACPGTCILLASTVVDGNLWNEVVRHGGYEVLRKPLHPLEVSRAVRMAWAYWNTQPPFVGK